MQLEKYPALVFDRSSSSLIFFSFFSVPRTALQRISCEAAANFCAVLSSQCWKLLQRAHTPRRRALALAWPYRVVTGNVRRRGCGGRTPRLTIQSCNCRTAAAMAEIFEAVWAERAVQVLLLGSSKRAMYEKDASIHSPAANGLLAKLPRPARHSQYGRAELHLYNC